MENLKIGVYVNGASIFSATMPVDEASEVDVSYLYDVADELRDVRSFGYKIGLGREQEYADALLALYYAGHGNKSIRTETAVLSLEESCACCGQNTDLTLRVSMQN